MTAYEVPENRWAFKLAPQLSGRAQQAYAVLNGEAASSYLEVKEAILGQYNVNEETYRQRFRMASMKTEETTRELRVRIEDLAKKWTKDCDTVDKLQGCDCAGTVHQYRPSRCPGVGAGAQPKH